MFTQFLFQTLRESGFYALEKQNNITGFEKEDDSVVTEADLYLSNFIKNEIKSFANKLHLNYCIIDEEGDKSFDDYMNSEYAFIIDPIDGTMNYSNGHVLWGISIGIFKNQQPYAGGVFMPALNKMIFTDSESIYVNSKGNYGYEKADITKKRFHGKNKTIAITNGALKLYDIYTDFIASENSTVSHMFFVNNGSHIGSVQRVNLWDTAASLSIGRVIGNFGWEISGNKMEIFTILCSKLTKI